MRSHPPVESALGQHIPAVERIAPPLPGRRKIIRRHAGNPHRLQILVQLEDFRMHPHIRRIHVDEDGHIAQDADPAAAPRPRADCFHCRQRQTAAPAPAPARGQLSASTCASACGSRRRNWFRPLRPRAGAELPPQLGVERVVDKPACFSAGRMLRNSSHCAAKLRHLSARDPENFPPPHTAAAPSSSQPGQSPRFRCARPVRRSARASIHPQSDKKLQADQEWIARKRRRTRIRRVAVSRGTERQHLPNMLFGRGQKSTQTRAPPDPGRRCRHTTAAN